MSEYNENEWSDWIKHLPGSKPPDLPDGEKIKVLCANGRKPGRAEIVSYWRWENINDGYDIVAYKRKKSAITAHTELMPEPAKIDDGNPAFPVGSGDMRDPTGMSLRQYAAIKLRVPNSGTDWLDAMILEAKRDELAAKTFPAVYAVAMKEAAEDSGLFQHDDWPTGLALDAYRMADAMLAVKKGGAK